MLKNLNKGLALFMAIAVMALNLGLINDVLADELEGSDQALARPIKGVSDSTPQPAEPELTVTPLPQPINAPEENNGGNGTGINCDSLMANMMLAQGADHSIAGDLNGDGTANLTDAVLLTQLDLGGPNGVPDGTINLTDVVLLTQMCPNTQVVTPVRPSCDYLMTNMMLAQGADHSIAGDLNGDGTANLTDAVLLTQLDLGGPNGVPDGTINLTDVVLLTQMCGNLLTTATTTPVIEPVVVPPTPELNNGNHSGNNLLNYIPNPVLIPTPQVLGEKVVGCKNKANTTLTQFKEGTLVRGCGPEVYVIKGGKKIHIINLETLRSKYFGKPILNIGDLINDIKDSSIKVVSAKK